MLWFKLFYLLIAWMNEMSDNKKIYISLDPSYQTLEVWSYLNDL
jgi:hypothetical protein